MMKKHAKKYCGKVIDEVANDGFDGGYGPIYDPVIEYQNDRNETKRIKSSWGTGMRCKLGEVIDVYEYKDKVFLDQRLDRCLLKCGFAFFGVLLIVIGVYFIFY
jgi:hypothetical protein